MWGTLNHQYRNYQYREPGPLAGRPRYKTARRT
jgi:hypothetical protein